MKAYTFSLLVAIGAIWLSLTSGFIAMYLILSGQLYSVSKASDPQRRLSASSKAREVEEAPTLADENGTSWGVQLRFDSPSHELNARLMVILASVGAVYDQNARAFTVTGESSRNPICIENAFPPGFLPSFTDDNTQYLIKGVNVKVNENSRSLAPSKLQLARLVSLAKSLARLGGTVVDAKQQPITQAGFKAVIAGKAKF
mgnify:CR=1 FL=1